MARINSERKRRFYIRWIEKYNNLKCSYCGVDCLLHAEESWPNKATIDHVIPLCKNGSNKQDNLVVACNKCNNEKSKDDKRDNTFSWSTRIR
jgi:5-methylcytosine-specific restriction endonuclease McrA